MYKQNGNFSLMISDILQNNVKILKPKITFLFSLPTENSISLKSINSVDLAIYLFPCKYSKTKILYSKYKYSVVIKWKCNLRRKSLSKNKKSMDYF